MEPLYIGNDIYIDRNAVLCIMSTWHPKAKKFIAQAKKEDKFLDFTAGNKRQSVIILNTGSVISSTWSAKDIVNNTI